MSDELLAASSAGEGDTVTKLLQQGVNVNSKQENGMTGLHESAKQGHDDIALWARKGLYVIFGFWCYLTIIFMGFSPLYY